MSKNFDRRAGEPGSTVSRRSLLQAAAGALAAPAVLTGNSAIAQARKEVVLVNFGGVAMKAFDDAFVKPFAQEGGRIVLDGSGALNGKILNMVQSGSVTWDICDAGITTLAELNPRGALEKIDYSIVDKSKVPADFAYEHGIVNYMFSSVLAWDSSKIKEQPTLADFFDLKKYPGRRMMRKDSQAMVELTLLADGVPPTCSSRRRRTASATPSRMACCSQVSGWCRRGIRLGRRRSRPLPRCRSRKARSSFSPRWATARRTRPLSPWSRLNSER
jgi:spermidine/putrescine-binding protein